MTRQQILALVLVLAGAIPVAGAEHEQIQKAQWTGYGGIEEAYNDNLQQKPPGPEKSGDFITTMTASAGWEKRRLGLLPSEFNLLVQGHVYNHIGNFNYVEIRPEGTYPLGFNTDFVLGYLFSPRRMLFEEDTASNVFYREHVLTAGLRGKYLDRKQLRHEILFRSYSDGYFGKNDGRDAWIPEVAWTVSYRVPLWGNRVEFAPRVGLAYADRHARRGNYDRTSSAVYTGFDARLPAGCNLRFRYERVHRRYTVPVLRSDGHRNNNFQRVDDYDQFHVFLSIPLPWAEGLALRPRYRFRQGVFDSPNKKLSNGHIGAIEAFDVHETGLEVVYAF